MNLLLESKLNQIAFTNMQESVQETPLDYLEEYLAARRGIELSEAKNLINMINEHEEKLISVVNETYKKAMVQLFESVHNANQQLLTEGKASEIAKLIGGKAKDTAVSAGKATGKALVKGGKAAGKAGKAAAIAALIKGKAAAKAGYEKGKDAGYRGAKAVGREANKFKNATIDTAKSAAHHTKEGYKKGAKASHQEIGKAKYHAQKQQVKGYGKALAKDLKHWKNKNVAAIKGMSAKKKLAVGAATVGLAGLAGGLKAYAKHRKSKKED